MLRSSSQRRAAILVGAWLALTAAPAAGAPRKEGAESPSSREGPQGESTRERLFGDLGGLRTRWEDAGLGVRGGYVAEGAANTRGGLRTGTSYEGLATLAVRGDLERLAGWRGTTAMASTIWPHGGRPSRSLVGDFQGISNIEADSGPALYQLWLQRKFLDGRASARVGQMLADAEFAGTAYGGALLNGSFGWPAFISGNTVNAGPAYDRAGLGFRLRAELIGSWYAQAGVYDGDTFDDAAGPPGRNPHGVRWQLGSRQGAFAIAETGWNGDSAGTYKLGGWEHTRAYGARSVYGLYASAERSLGHGWGVWLRGGPAGPRSRAGTAFALDGGVHCVGLLPRRSEDVLALGAAHAELGAPAAGGETALELIYRAKITPWLRLSPDAQWILRPGGVSSRPAAVVLAMRTSLTF